jgi:hypothetical protein
VYAVFNSKERDIMKNLIFIKSISTIFGTLLFLLSILVSPVSFAAGAIDDFSPDDIVAELKPKLELNDQQVKDLTAALGELGKTLHALIEKEEANKEEHSDDFIKGVKQAQDDYQKKLKGILNDKQQQTYNELREAAIMDMMKDLAEIKLLDIQPKIGFSDEQLQKLVPVLAENMRGLIKVAWENAGKHLRFRQKIKLAKKLKHMQSDAQKQVQQILTGEQYQKWEELKKQQQEQQKK